MKRKHLSTPYVECWCMAAKCGFWRRLITEEQSQQKFDSWDSAGVALKRQNTRKLQSIKKTIGATTMMKIEENWGLHKWKAIACGEKGWNKISEKDKILHVKTYMMEFTVDIHTFILYIDKECVTGNVALLNRTDCVFIKINHWFEQPKIKGSFHLSKHIHGKFRNV